MDAIKISRYPSDFSAFSDLYRMDDALDLLSFLKSEDFVSNHLIDIHSKTPSAAKLLARRISSHANLASKYAGLSLQSPPEISFLPGYYCILNLAKCISLCGPYSNEFNHHSRWHGATYNANHNNQSFLTDEIRVRGGGALALFYKTLTNETIRSDRVIKPKDFYYLIPEIGSELSFVTPQVKAPWFVFFESEIQAGKIAIQATLRQWDAYGKEKIYKGNVRSIPCLKGFKKKPKSNGIFVTNVTPTVGSLVIDLIRNVVKTEFLIFMHKDSPCGCFEQGSTLPMPAEFATALAFYHLSSICRYNPEFMQKISQSKAWPVLLVLRRHGLYNFILAIWSFFLQKNYVLSNRR